MERDQMTIFVSYKRRRNSTNESKLLELKIGWREINDHHILLKFSLKIIASSNILKKCMGLSSRHTPISNFTKS